MELEPRLALIEYTDMYLNHHRHSSRAYEYVIEVLNKFDAMVSLARERATEALTVPISNVRAIPPPRFPAVENGLIAEVIPLQRHNA